MAGVRAYFVRVHLGELAVYLTDLFDCPMEVTDAENWLIIGPATCRPTDVRCVYYTEINPLLTLDDRVIAWARQTQQTDDFLPHFQPTGE
jgi:hypothetical protein